MKNFHIFGIDLVWSKPQLKKKIRILGEWGFTKKPI